MIWDVLILVGIMAFGVDGLHSALVYNTMIPLSVLRVVILRCNTTIYPAQSYEL